MIIYSVKIKTNNMETNQNLSFMYKSLNIFIKEGKVCIQSLEGKKTIEHLLNIEDCSKIVEGLNETIKTIKKCQ